MFRLFLVPAGALALAVFGLPLFALAVLAAIVILAGPAAASDLVASTGTVVIPYGDVLAALVTGNGPEILAAIALFLLRKLPRSLYETLQMLRVEQLLTQGIAYGLTAVAGASQGRSLNVETGSRVLAAAASYAASNAPRLVRWLGGDDLLRDKLIARLDFDPGVSRPAIERELAALRR